MTHGPASSPPTTAREKRRRRRAAYRDFDRARRGLPPWRNWRDHLDHPEASLALYGGVLFALVGLDELTFRWRSVWIAAIALAVASVFWGWIWSTYPRDE